MSERKDKMRKKMFFVYNPYAGKATIRNKLLDIIDIFVKGGYEVTVYPTQAEGDAVYRVAELEDQYDIVVCSGGDGTLDEVVTGMMRREVILPVGYVPAGSTNDFAGSLGLPKNMLSAAETVVRGEEFPCDIGSFNDDTFVYIAAFGLFTDVSYETSQEFKNIVGHLAYLLEGMKRIANIPSYHVKIYNEEIQIEDDFMFGMITNSVSVGGFKRITGKYVELNDGEFEVTLIKRPRNPIELNQIMAALVMKTIDTECMFCFKASRLTIEAEEPIAWTLDGENGGRHEKAVISNLKEALRIMVPARKENELRF